MGTKWWTETTALYTISTFGSIAVFIAGWALFGVIPGFALTVIFVFLFARSAARHL